MKTKKIVLTGILSALAIALTSLELIFTPVLPLGVHIGLANIVIMFALIEIDTKSSIFIVIIKSLFILITRGPSAFFMSFCGAVLSFLIIYLLCRKTKSSLLLTSIAGAVFHNIGQLVAATIFTQSLSTLYYGFILIIGGIIAGTFTGIVLGIVFKAFNHFSYIKK